MLKVAKERGGGCRTNERTVRWCLICDNLWRVDKKLICQLLRWSPQCALRTWINRAVILLSMLNVVLAQYTLDVVNDGDDFTGHFTRQWAVHIEGGQQVADRIAAKHGFVNLGKIFQNFYHFEHERIAKRSVTPHSEYHRNLTNEAEVKWAQQQVVKRRSKRDLISPRPRTKSSTRLKPNSAKFNDVEWPQMWYLNRGEGLDMNVEGAWREGISGSGVVVTILDDGLEKNHPDLMANYDPQASYDVNQHDEDPMPRYDPIDSNRHGTRCAGEVAAVANNTLCSVGVAFGASVGGVRMLDGDVTDAVEARSLSLNPQHIDIYSASWGPDDDGKTVDGPGELATRAFIEGVTKGRQGKGSIFVWASGNGGREHDNCNCDGYTNSIWTLSISSATENGLVPWYSEACSSTLATTYSSGSVAEKQIVTTDLRHKCTNGHTGTSASAPLAAGICALALEANRDLTWRDMQHIVVRTARPGNLKSSDWKVNGVGRNVSHSFGYGLMDATAMVKLARTWKTVPEQHRCEVLAPHKDKTIPPRGKVILDLNVTECPGVNYLEHVQAKISLSSHQRGDLQIYLTSPAGTRSTLLARRPKDSSKNPFNSWPFMSVHTWGEMPFGIWQLEIHNGGGFLGRAYLQDWSLMLYGTLQHPQADTKSNQMPPRRFLSKPSASTRPNAIHLGSFKSNKTSGSSNPNKSNRKNIKNWKGKAPTGGTRVSTSGSSLEGMRNTHSGSPSKSTKAQKVWHLNRTKEQGSGRGGEKTTPGPPWTIVLGPGAVDFPGLQKVPDVFQRYPKVEQLFPVYVNTGRIYNEENFLLPKIELSAPYFLKSNANTNTNTNTKSVATNSQKTERQNRFDTSSLTRLNTEGSQNSGSRRPLPRKHQMQGQFESWQMLFYGTEVTPNNEDAHLGRGRNHEQHEGKSKLKNVLPGDPDDLGDQVSNHLEPETTGSRGWKDQATRRDEVTRTTMDPLMGPSSGCATLTRQNSQCIECAFGLYLYGGRCEVNCPPKTYPTIDAKKRAVCLPCHYTCLTCAGESDGHCTSCRDESVPVPSGLKDTNGETKEVAESEDHRANGKAQDQPFVTVTNDMNHLSWGRRSPSKDRQTKAVTKKVLEPYDAPRTLFYCYPSRMLNELRSSETWYYRMSVLFALNLVFLLGFFLYLLYRRFCLKNKRNHSTYQFNSTYLTMRSGGSLSRLEGDKIILSSSSDDEDEDLRLKG